MKIIRNIVIAIVILAVLYYFGSALLMGMRGGHV